MEVGSIWFWLAILWSLPWKSWGLWRAARNNQRFWFISMIIFQTLGLLPIIYIFLFQKDNNKKKDIVSKILKLDKVKKKSKKFLKSKK